MNVLTWAIGTMNTANNRLAVRRLRSDVARRLDTMSTGVSGDGGACRPRGTEVKIGWAFQCFSRSVEDAEAIDSGAANGDVSSTHRRKKIAPMRRRSLSAIAERIRARIG